MKDSIDSLQRHTRQYWNIDDLALSGLMTLRAYLLKVPLETEDEL